MYATKFQETVNANRTRGFDDAKETLAKEGFEFAQTHFLHHESYKTAESYGYWTGFFNALVDDIRRSHPLN
jgi:hypothetical protein